MSAGRVERARVKSFGRARSGGETPADSQDWLAKEEPLELRVAWEDGGHRRRESIAVTMRTPGHDEELALGFLWSEGLIRGREEVWRVAPCADEPNVLDVDLAAGVRVDLEALSRHVYTSSSCGVCGKASLEAVQAMVERLGEPQSSTRPIAVESILELPDRLEAAQEAFSMTGGLHATGVFDPEGELILVREDVGRHNAMDKAVGALLRDADSEPGRLPGAGRWALVSGRASFELVQKAAAAGFTMLAAVGAPSSLAVELAAQSELVLVGFLRDGRFNAYAGFDRLVEPVAG